MQKLVLLKHKRNSPSSGFITLEILVSIIIALAFVSVAMQTLVVAMMMKVQAQETQRANQLIDEDIEDLKEQVSLLPQDANHNTVCSATAYANGYAQDLWDSFTTSATNASYTAIPTVNLLEDGTGKQLGLDRTHFSVIANKSEEPHVTLKVLYEVKEYDGTTWGTLIEKRYVEVIPDVALRCP